ncbi:hypothetical protein FRX31_015780 [Thalictrum thalictroides]|uniref:Uncharacterized protein n=1 Tax=Thalictrum thalictroides TaxID=46969 RepID=A0A7J6WE36_THATH|nr:hypothetical protein FRX31_015780 [Thalictrum thalictroides]
MRQVHICFYIAPWLWKSGLPSQVQGGFSISYYADTVEELLIAWPASLGTEIGRRSLAMLPYAVIWVLWRIGNDAIFNSNMASVNKICVEIKAYIWFWMTNWQGRKNFFPRLYS